MQPSQRFVWNDAAELRAFVAAHSFAQISVAVDGRIEICHAPLSQAEDGGFRFHLARANGLTPLLDGRAVLATVLGEDAYISPDWYGTGDQVPTWNYRLVEIRGTVRRLDEAELAPQIDALSAVHEAALLPKTPWTSAKMRAGRLDAMIKAIAGFAIETPALHGIAKLGQNKSAAERAGAIAGLRGVGRGDFADLMERA